MKDIAIIGGGIAGLGVAKAAVHSGKSAVVFERGKLGGTTSAASLRIIHGGFRYLQSFSVRRVLESITAQDELLKLYPSLIRPLHCLMPLERRGMKRRPFIDVACKLYSGLCALAGAKSLPSPSYLSAEESSLIFPSFRDLFSKGALEWYDAYLTDHMKLVGLLSQELAQEGVDLHEGTVIRRVESVDSGYHLLGPEGEDYGCFRTVANTAGAWIGTIAKPDPMLSERPHFWCRAFNIVVERPLESDSALGVTSPEGRLLFLVPHGNSTRIGTWYSVLSETELTVELPEDDVESFYNCIIETLPGWGLKRSEVLGVEVGVLPRQDLSRQEVEPASKRLLHQSVGFVDVISTKYTTFLPQGREVVRRLSPLLR